MRMISSIYKLALNQLVDLIDVCLSGASNITDSLKHYKKIEDKYTCNKSRLEFCYHCNVTQYKIN